MYSSLANVLIYLSIVMLLVSMMLLFSDKMYKKIDSELEENILQLELLNQFDEE